MDALRAFIAEYAGPDDDVDDVLRAVIGAVDRYSRYSRGKPKSEVRNLYRSLAVAARASKKADDRLREAAIAIEGVLGWGLVSDQDEHNRRKFVEAVRVAQSGDESRLRVDTILEFAEATSNRIASRSRAVDDLRRSFGLELVRLFQHITRKRPTAAKTWAIDKPGTAFGRFVALAIEVGDPQNDKLQHLKKHGAKFVLDARKSFEAAMQFEEETARRPTDRHRDK